MKCGDRLGGCILIEKIGSGGNADVWKAQNIESEAYYALKILRNTRPHAEPYLRFRDEVRIHSGLSEDDGILPIIDYNTPTDPKKSNPAWLSMPIASTFSNVLANYGQLEDVIEAVSSIAATLSRLASDGIYHRDIKPGNLFYLDGEWLVGDFGLVDYPDKASLTKAGKKLGPANFHAPEMLLDAEGALGGPADVWSLAKTLWVTAAGLEFPFPGHQRADDPICKLETYIAHAHCPTLNRLIDLATQLDPSRRPSILDVHEELEAWLSMDRNTGDNEDGIPRQLVAEIRDSVHSDRVREERNREMERHASVVLGSCGECLRKIAGQFEQEGLKLDVVAGGTSVIHNYTDETVLSGRDYDIFSGESVNFLRKGNPTFATLYSGFGLNLNADETVELAAAHILNHRDREYTVLWCESGSETIDSAKLEMLSKDLQSGLQKNMAHALRMFGDCNED